MISIIYGNGGERANGSSGFIWNVINENIIEEMYLWRKYTDESKNRKLRLKEFLLGRKIICDVSENILVEKSDIGVKGFVKCDISCDLKYEIMEKIQI
jgi:hypothetical protein